MGTPIQGREFQDVAPVGTFEEMLRGKLWRNFQLILETFLEGTPGGIPKGNPESILSENSCRSSQRELLEESTAGTSLSIRSLRNSQRKLVEESPAVKKSPEEILG